MTLCSPIEGNYYQYSALLLPTKTLGENVRMVEAIAFFIDLNTIKEGINEYDTREFK